MGSRARSLWKSLGSVCSACSVLYVVVSASLSAQQAPLEAIPVRGHIFLIGGAGANVTVSAGPDGVLLVDSGSAQNADRVLAAVKDLAAADAKRGLATTLVDIGSGGGLPSVVIIETRRP